MRALFLVHNLPERGSYFRARELAARVAARGHDVHLVMTSEHRMHRPTRRTSPTGLPGVDITEVEAPNRTLFNDKQEGYGVPDNAYRLWLAARERWDLVYGFSHKPDCVLPGLAARARGARLVLDWSDWWGGPEGLYQSCVVGSEPFLAMPRPIRAWRRATFAVDAWMESHVYEWADAVTLISEEFIQHPGAPDDIAQKSLVLHSGSPLREIVPLHKGDARAALGLELPPDAVVFGYVANFHTDEPLLLEAFADVCGRCPEARLLVVGAGFDRMTPAIQEATRGRITHLGRRPFPQMATCLAAADVLLLPLGDVALNRARYPHKLSDYVAAGRPVIACDVGETGRLLRRYGFGKLCRPHPQDLAAAMMALVGERPRWDTVGAETRAAAETFFDWDLLAGRLFAFWEERLGLKV